MPMRNRTAGLQHILENQQMVNENSTILFVDDEETILDIAREFFEQKGYPVITAEDGLDAVKILEKEKIDCCFTDIHMPGMDGIELAERIREIDNTIPVVVMTGYPSMETTLQTLRNGVVDFLIKPVSLNQMEICLKRVLRERRLFTENLLLKKEVESKEKLERLNQELQFKLQGLNILNNILSELSEVSSNQDIFSRVVDLTLDITNADVTNFSVISGCKGKPVVVARAEKDHQGSAESDTVQLEHDATDCTQTDMEKLIQEAAADKIPMLISKNTGDRLPANIRSCMIVPLNIREKNFGVLTAATKYGDRCFGESDLYYLSFLTRHAAHAIEKLALYENIYNNLFSTLYAFVRAIELRDPYTQQHSSRVTDIAIQLGQSMGCSHEELDILNFAGPLHDIGKIGIPDNILLKPGHLTQSEYEKIKEHPDLGADIVGKLGMWGREQEIIRCHHEWYDGSGYPSGLKGDEIPLLSRILSVADAFDAMASDRAYRKRMELPKVLKIIQSAANTQFDPDVVHAFIALHESGTINLDAA
jgi:response regulator RpfG family c-di-GMP phosphodiesterase